MWDENRELLIRGARALGELRDEVVFVGGCSTGLLITDPGAGDIRPTRDVDVIVATATRAEYRELERRLRAIGFRDDMKIICRWHCEDLTLDVMPTDPEILGFSNAWYPGAIAHAVDHVLEPGLAIHVVSPTYFCATKIAAFHGRGKGDFAGSHDLEDFLAVVDGRLELVAEVRAAADDVRTFLAAEARAFLNLQEFLDVLPGSLAPDPASQARLPLLVSRLQAIASLR
ncbi:MAG TPA: hypothetical protein VF701_20540 [Thermoanaerobaculia bacterium]